MNTAEEWIFGTTLVNCSTFHHFSWLIFSYFGSFQTLNQFGISCSLIKFTWKKSASSSEFFHIDCMSILMLILLKSIKQHLIKWTLIKRWMIKWRTTKFSTLNFLKLFFLVFQNKSFLWKKRFFFFNFFLLFLIFSKMVTVGKSNYVQ